ncbi:MAG: Rieske 2Fe-2S domain-containing protein [Bacteroidota bacterium]
MAEPITRKQFISKCGSACLGLAGFSLLMQGCKTMAYVPYQLDGKRISVKKSDVLAKEYVLIRVDGLNAPIYLSHGAEGYHAAFMVCTHKQCELTPYGKVLHCPCHGSEFDSKGAVLNGPADQPLTMFKVSEDEDSIYIQ